MLIPRSGRSMLAHKMFLSTFINLPELLTQHTGYSTSFINDLWYSGILYCVNDLQLMGQLRPKKWFNQWIFLITWLLDSGKLTSLSILEISSRNVDDDTPTIENKKASQTSCIVAYCSVICAIKTSCKHRYKQSIENEKVSVTEAGNIVAPWYLPIKGAAYLFIDSTTTKFQSIQAPARG